MTAVDLDAQMLLQLQEEVDHEHTVVTVHAAAEDTGLATNSADLIICLQAFHWFDANMALEEFNRVLKPTGTLVCAWNDRDLSHDWVSSLEDIFESHNLLYNRHMKQTETITDNGSLLCSPNGKPLFEKILPMQTIAHMQTLSAGVADLNALHRTLSYVRNALHDDALADLESEVRDLVESQFGSTQLPIEFPWQTKAFLLSPI